MSTPSPAEAAPPGPPPVDLTTPQLTLRAVSTGMLFGGMLSLCNIYLGLNMSVTAALLGFGFWQATTRALKLRPFNVLENNINQTAASAGASISSAGLVAPIPALTMMTGHTLGYGPLTAWVLSVALVGVVVAIALRRQMLVVDKLPFPGGMATGQTLKEIYAKGEEAARASWPSSCCTCRSSACRGASPPSPAGPSPPPAPAPSRCTTSASPSTRAS